MILSRNTFIYVSSVLISLLPIFVLISVAGNTTLFNIIDSLTLSFLISAFAVLLASVSVSLSLLFSVFIALITSLFIFVSNQYFLFYGSYITYDTFLLFNDLLLAANQFILPTHFIFFVIISLSIAIFLSRIKGKCKTQHMLAVSVSLFILSTLFSWLHQSNNIIVSKLNPSKTHYLKLNEQSPVLYFLRSTPFWAKINKNDNLVYRKQDFQNLAKNIVNNANISLPNRYDFKHFKSIFNSYPFYKTGSNTNRPWQNSPTLNDIRNNSQLKPNVLLIVLESVRAYETGFYNSAYSLTPNLDKISKIGLQVPTFYANSRQTVKAEQALLCSAIDYKDNASYSVKHERFRGNCLPNILKQNGYVTTWFHGYTKSFYNRDNYFKSVGFDNLFAKEEFLVDGYENKNDIGWGVPDKDLFTKALDKLENLPADQPFFAEILTLTNHQPFNWDFGDVPIANPQHENSNKIYKNYRKGIAYTDQALGEFWEQFSVSKLAQNTIVIITGDHGVPYYPDSMTSKPIQEEVLFRLPLTIVFPNNEYTGVINEPLSQVDIAPTVLSVLNISHSNSFIGRPFLGNQATLATRPIFLRDATGFYFRYGDLKCNPSDSICSKTDETCASVGTLYCSAKDTSLFPFANEAIHYNNFLDLALETGFAEL